MLCNTAVAASLSKRAQCDDVGARLDLLGRSRGADPYYRGMSNALDPNRMTPAERLAELGRILAAGLIRMKAREVQSFIC